MTETELAWLCGWLEGEGTFFCHIEPSKRSTRKAYARLTVRAVSVDKETIEKAQRIAGGRIYGPYNYGGGRKDHWQWGLSGRQQAADFMRLIRPHMSTRRQAQIDAALAKGAPS